MLTFSLDLSGGLLGDAPLLVWLNHQTQPPVDLLLSYTPNFLLYWQIAALLLPKKKQKYET